MRAEAESTSSHGAAIVAFEASGLRALSSPFERKTVAIQRQIDLKQKLYTVSVCLFPYTSIQFLCVCFRILVNSLCFKQNLYTVYEYTETKLSWHPAH